MSSAVLQQSSALVYTAGALLSTLLATFLAKLFVQRSQFLKMRRQGLVRTQMDFPRYLYTLAD